MLSWSAVKDGASGPEPMETNDMAYVIKVTNTQGPWDNGEVPYQFGDGISDELAATFEACMVLWESFLTDDGKELVKFVKKTAQHDTFIKITGIKEKNAQTSANTIGSPKKKGQEFSNFTFNTYRKSEPGSIPHELAHVLGLAHEHQRNRADDMKEVKNAAEARLYYRGAGKVVDPNEEQGRRNSEPKANKNANAEIVYSEVDQEECWKLWDSLYTPVGDYDLKSITHYPKVENWKWNYETWNKFPEAALGKLNLPTAAQVANNQWKPGPTDIDALKKLYAQK